MNKQIKVVVKLPFDICRSHIVIQKKVFCTNEGNDVNDDRSVFRKLLNKRGVNVSPVVRNIVGP